MVGTQSKMELLVHLLPTECVYETFYSRLGSCDRALQEISRGANEPREDLFLAHLKTWRLALCPHQKSERKK